MQIPKIFSSSVDPQKLALTVKGLILGIIPVVLFVSGTAQINLGQQDLTSFADATFNAIIAVSSALSAIMVVVGIIRKILVKAGAIKTAE